MRSSAEDAIRLLNKWKSEFASLRILFTTAGCELRFDERILAVQDNMLLIEGSRPCQFWVSLSAANFEYTEPREMGPVKARISGEITYICTLKIRQSDGGLCLLNELRRPG
jgi:hypothetical protein